MDIVILLAVLAVLAVLAGLFAGGRELPMTRTRRRSREARAVRPDPVDNPHDMLPIAPSPTLTSR